MWNDSDCILLHSLVDNTCVKQILHKKNDNNISPIREFLEEDIKKIDDQVNNEMNICVFPEEIINELKLLLDFAPFKINRINQELFDKIREDPTLLKELYERLDSLEITDINFSILYILSYMVLYPSTLPSESDLIENLAIKNSMITETMPRANSESTESQLRTPLRSQSASIIGTQCIFKQIAQMTPGSPTTEFINALDKRFPLKNRCQYAEIRPLLFAAFSRQLDIGPIVIHGISVLNKTPFVHPSVKLVWNMTGEAMRSIKYTMQMDPMFKISKARNIALTLLDGQLVEFASTGIRNRCKELIKLITNSSNANLSIVTQRLDSCIDNSTKFINCLTRFVENMDISLELLLKLKMPSLDIKYGSSTAYTKLVNAVNLFKMALRNRSDDDHVHQFMLYHIDDMYFDLECVYQKQTKTAVVSNFVMMDRGEISLDQIKLTEFEGKAKTLLNAIRNPMTLDKILSDIKENKKVPHSFLLYYLINQPIELTHILVKQLFSNGNSILPYLEALLQVDINVVLDKECLSSIVDYIMSLPKILFSKVSMTKIELILLGSRMEIVYKIVNNVENSINISKLINQLDFMSFALIPPLLYAPNCSINEIIGKIRDMEISKLALEDISNKKETSVRFLRQFLYTKMTGASIKHINNLIQTNHFETNDHIIRYTAHLIFLSIIQTHTVKGDVLDEMLVDDVKFIINHQSCVDISNELIDQALNEIMCERIMDYNDIEIYKNSYINKGRPIYQIMDNRQPIYDIQPNTKGIISGFLAIGFIHKQILIKNNVTYFLIKHNIKLPSYIKHIVSNDIFDISVISDEQLEDLVKIKENRFHKEIVNEMLKRYSNKIVIDTPEIYQKILQKSTSIKCNFPRFPPSLVAKHLVIPEKEIIKIKCDKGVTKHSFSNEYVTISSIGQCIAKSKYACIAINNTPIKFVSEFTTESNDPYTLIVEYRKYVHIDNIKEKEDFIRKKAEEFENIWEAYTDFLILSEHEELPYPEDFIICRKEILNECISYHGMVDVPFDILDVNEVLRICAQRHEQRAYIGINRIMALKGIMPLFVQLDEIVESGGFTYKQLFQMDKIWTVTLLGENASDAGGPGREIYQEIFNELINGVCDVFISSPNLKYQIPNPRAKKSHLKLAGALIASLIPMGQSMPLNLPNFVYRRLALNYITLHDLATIDDNVKDIIEAINYIKNSIDGSQINLTFVCTDLDGKKCELCRNGAQTIVTQDNIDTFIKLFKEKRCGELNYAISAMSEGFREVFGDVVVSDKIIRLVQSPPGINYEKFLTSTRFENSYNPDIIHAFKEAIRQMSDCERSRLFKFATGLSIPPNKPSPYLKVTVLGNDKIPSAATCFNVLYIPKITNSDVMLKKLRCSLEFGSIIEDEEFDYNYLE